MPSLRASRKRELSLAWVVRRAISDFVECHRDDTQGELHLLRGRSADRR
jgi:hypothetical protein